MKNNIIIKLKKKGKYIRIENDASNKVNKFQDCPTCLTLMKCHISIDFESSLSFLSVKIAIALLIGFQCLFVQDDRFITHMQNESKAMRMRTVSCVSKSKPCSVLPSLRIYL